MKLLILVALVSPSLGVGGVDPPSPPGEPTINPPRIAVPPGAPDPGYVPNRRIAGVITFEDYPPAAIRAGAEGRVVVELQVGRDGSVSDCFLILSSGSPDLDRATCDLIRQRYLYSPAMRDGRALLSSDQVEIIWSLRED